MVGLHGRLVASLHNARRHCKLVQNCQFCGSLKLLRAASLEQMLLREVLKQMLLRGWHGAALHMMYS
jgi:hypothetical protein